MTYREGPITTADIFGELEGNPRFCAARNEIAWKTNLAININLARRGRRMTQAELADAAGMRQPRIAELESASGNPMVETIARIAAALGTSVDRLLAAPNTDTRTSLVHVAERADEFDDLAVASRASWLISANDNFSLVA